MDKVKWQCPICDCTAYQRFGGVPLPAIKISKVGGNSGKSKEETREPTTLRLGTHFMCRGCSVFFSNPRLFHADPIREKGREELDKFISSPEFWRDNVTDAVDLKDQ